MKTKLKYLNGKGISYRGRYQDIVHKIKNENLSPRRISRNTIERIREFDPSLTLITVLEESARRDAMIAEKQIKQRNLSSDLFMVFHFRLKDVIFGKRRTWTLAFKIMLNHVK